MSLSAEDRKATGAPAVVNDIEEFRKNFAIFCESHLVGFHRHLLRMKMQSVFVLWTIKEDARQFALQHIALIENLRWREQ